MNFGKLLFFKFWMKRFLNFNPCVWSMLTKQLVSFPIYLILCCVCSLFNMYLLLCWCLWFCDHLSTMSMYVMLCGSCVWQCHDDVMHLIGFLSSFFFVKIFFLAFLSSATHIYTFTLLHLKHIVLVIEFQKDMANLSTYIVLGFSTLPPWNTITNKVFDDVLVV